MSTAELFMTPEDILEFVAETRACLGNSMCVFGDEDGSEYGISPFITFYIYHTEERYLSLCYETIELYQELQGLIDEPFLRVFNTKTQKWVKATPQKTGREMLREHALWSEKERDPFFIGATDQEGPEATARWAIDVIVTDGNKRCYSTVKITFRDKWYRQNGQVWREFVDKWLRRLCPDQCYSGYEIGTTTTLMGAYESDVLERVCADYFYGMDVDHPFQTLYHDFDHGTDFVCYSAIGSGIRTPTWCFLLSPYWRGRLGKSVAEVKAALAHQAISIDEIPHPVSKLNPNGEPSLWIRLGELNLYPVDEGLPELLVLANALIRPIRCNDLCLYSLAPWDDDPNPRFDSDNGPKWMARFDAESEWPSKEQRFPREKERLPVPSCPGGPFRSDDAFDELTCPPKESHQEVESAPHKEWQR